MQQLPLKAAAPGLTTRSKEPAGADPQAVAVPGGEEAADSRVGVNARRCTVMPDVSIESSEVSVSSSRNFATSRKVQRLLDINVNENFRELVLYMNDVVPEFLEGLHVHTGDSLPPEKTTPKLQQREQYGSTFVSTQPESVTSGGVGPVDTTGFSLIVPSSVALRKALEGRIADLHRHFLQEWSILNEVFEEVASLVTTLYHESETLETVLGSHATLTGELTGLMNTLQAELALVQRREQEIKEFKGKYHFTAAEQKILEEGPVDATYLDVLCKVQATHHKCRQMLLSRENYQSAAAVMDSTYIAIIKGSEKLARYLVSVSARATAGATCASGEIPEAANFYFRCVDFLREESKTQWVSVVEEVARLRRAGLLRQYFHLMTTGSATTSSRTYRSGSNSREPSAMGNEGGCTGVRPLEAEIGNPVFFFSSLFAWLHQAIVDESDFFSSFFGSSPSFHQFPSTGTNAGGIVAARGLTSPVRTVDASGCDAEGDDPSALSISAVLDSIFDVLCKHIHGVLEGVLERFLRTASSLQDSEGGLSNAETGATGNNGPSDDGRPTRPGPSGPIGLTGGIARLLTAATGRSLSLMGKDSKNSHHYENVMNRSQMEALVATRISSLTSGLQTTHALLQLFSYCSFSTFTVLLGREAALTRLIADDAKLQLLRVYHTIAKQLSEHSLDSVASVISRSSAIRRLSSAEARESRLGDHSGCFVVDFLLEYVVEEDGEVGNASFHDGQLKQQGGSNNSGGWKTSSFGGRSASSNPYLRSGLSKYQAQAVEVLRTLQTMVLPVPPEVVECLHVLELTIVESLRHAELMDSLQAATARNQTIRISSMADEGAGSTAEEEPSVQNEQFFGVVVQHLLSFPTVLASHRTVNDGIDEPCKLVLYLNTMIALHGTLTAHVNTTTNESKGICYIRPFAETVTERIQHLTKELSTTLSRCVVQHYFGKRTGKACEVSHTVDSVSNPGVNGGAGASSGPAVGGVATDTNDTNEPFDQESIKMQLSALYSIVAASGRVYIPLVSSIASDVVRGQVVENVQQAAIEAYGRWYELLVKLVSNGPHGAEVLFSDDATQTLITDLHPQKLRLLLDGNLSETSRGLV
uniref:Conserved oligomeric Golgi complex subunit 6 n=1 Tax=Trypanosoma congolense (strain IL3000) TaxID=1068625 RepID=G0UVR4_TRYCI|nr:conserved hypothetical protein [Trypanosoma congolense IL3000]